MEFKIDTYILESTAAQDWNVDRLTELRDQFQGLRDAADKGPSWVGSREIGGDRREKFLTRQKGYQNPKPYNGGT